MESKVSRRLKEPLAKEICEHIYAPRLARDFAKQFAYLCDVNQAHLLMLHKSGLITPDVAVQLAKGLVQMEAEGPAAVELDPAKEDPYFNLESKLMEITGRDIGGRLHMGRSRNDIGATIDRLRARTAVLELIDAIALVRTTALTRAAQHTDTVMPGYTHLQPAQPITYGFYLTSVADALGRDLDRLQSAMVRVNSSPLGAGALAGTRFAIDREATAASLGFPSVVPSTLDSVANRDFAWEVLSALSIVAVNWGRVAQDLYVWSTPEFGLISFPDRVASTSSIMPQKKNPAVLEYLKGKSGQIIGNLTTSLIALKGTHFTHAGDSSRESMRTFWEAVEESLRCLSLFNLILGSAESKTDAMLRHVRFDFSVATDLADGLVAEGGMSFRDAHHVVGGLVRLAMDAGLSAEEMSSGMLDQAAVDVIGRAVQWSPETLRKYLNPIESVKARLSGGPAPQEVERSIQRQTAHLQAAVQQAQSLREHVAGARQHMKSQVSALAAG